MTRRRKLIWLGILAVLILSLDAILRLWPSLWLIDPLRAREIALDHLESSPYLEHIDTTRATITWRGDIRAYVVDFAWEGAGQIWPGLWSEGYGVIVDAKCGHVEEAYAYER